MIWLLATDHRWEQLYILANESSQRGDYFAGAWDCGCGLVLAVFRMSGAYLYNLHDEAAAEGDNEGGKNCVPIASLIYCNTQHSRLFSAQWC
jgi:hypothetical protein